MKWTSLVRDAKRLWRRWPLLPSRPIGLTDDEGPTGSWGASGTSRASVHVIDLSATARPPAAVLRSACADSVTGCLIVVDASGVDVLLPVTLAALVRLGRLAAVRNGGMVVVAGEGAARSIRRAGLTYSLACAPSVEEAHELVRLRSARFGADHPGSISSR